MSTDPTRYPRRQFLGQCAAAPLAIRAVAGVLPVAFAAEDVPIKLLNQPTMPEADLAKEVDSLLKIVDPEVIYRYIPLSEDRNAWPFWVQANKALVDEPEDDEFQEGIDLFLERGSLPAAHVLKRILAWVDANETARKLTDQGIARGAIELPRAKKSIRLSLPMDEMSIIRRLAQLKGVFARACLHRGDTTRAAREAASILAMGTILIRGECMVIDYLVALAVVGIGMEAMYQIAIAADGSDEQASAAIQSLASAKTTIDDVKRACRVEFCRRFLPYVASFPNKADSTELAARWVIDFEPDYKPDEWQLQEYDRSIRQIAALLGGHQRPFNKEATIRLGSDLHVRFFAELDKPWPVRNRKLLEPLKKELSAWPAEVEPDIWVIAGLSDNPNPPRKLTKNDVKQARDALRMVDNVFGKHMVEQGTSVIFGSPMVEMQQARLEARRVKIALRLYARKHGHVPTELDALVEDRLLPEVPKDPYDAKPFKYSAKRRVIWSVGPEGKNEGMVPEQEDPENPFDEDFELTWRVRRT